jgi:hypothetical protein
MVIDSRTEQHHFYAVPAQGRTIHADPAPEAPALTASLLLNMPKIIEMKKM